MAIPPSVGLIIPSANRLTEPQFNTYLPAGVGAYVTRLRMAGKFRKALAELKPQLIEAAQALSDIKPSVIVFHCTANSMESGLAHEKAIVDIIEQASGCPTITTAQALTQAFDRVGIKKLVLISPYVQATNQLEAQFRGHPLADRSSRHRRFP
jgi:maleate cis-trans isomerase